MTTLDAGWLWSERGWRPHGGIDVGPDGRLARMVAEGARGSSGPWRVPGIANLHSHAFQRAMAGLAERRAASGQGGSEDSFWTWRETMYRFASRFEPDTLYAVAAQLYVEMLEAGYTAVCEFHYLHHAPDGRPYADAAAMSRALIAAARDTGIRLTLLPVLYMSGGFDGRPLSERQRRFGHAVDAYLRLLDSLQGERSSRVAVGCALHSLRAVPPDAIAQVLGALPGDSPVHLHIAEQTGEVEECVALRGARPVRWLLDHVPVDARWTLVHATHLDPGEVEGVARSGATVALCPTTEANLGDGLFPLRGYLEAGGAWGIGSDSHVSVSPVEELRWLEYGQRLQSLRRNVAVAGETHSVGETLLRGVARSAASSTGQPVGRLEPGYAADFLTLDVAAPAFAGMRPDEVVDRWVFGGNRPLVREVHVGGERLVAEGRHRAREAVAAAYRRAMERLLGTD